MTTDFLIVDIATAPIPDAGSYVEPVSAPGNYKDAEKIAAYVAEKTAERLATASLDVDLCRITAIGLYDEDGATVTLCQSEDDECMALGNLAVQVRNSTIITYGGFNFDLPVLMRRARYLGVDFPTINLDRYRSKHLDLCDVLADRDPKRRRPLSFYVRRLGWTDLVKPLSGEEEAQVPNTGKWDELAVSVRHDITATYRLAQWLGYVPVDKPVLAEPELF